MKNELLAILAVALLAGPLVADAAPVTFSVEGVFSSDSTATPGLAGDTYRLNVFLDDTTVPTSTVSGWTFLGSGELFVAGVLISTSGAGVVQGGSTPGSFQVSAILTAGGFFTGFFSGAFDPSIVFAAGTNVLADPATLASQGVVGFTDEFTAAGVFSRVGDSATLLVPEPGTLALLGLGLAGLGLRRRRKGA